MTAVPPCCAETEEPPCPQHRQAAKTLRHTGPRSRRLGASLYTGAPDKDPPGTRIAPRGSRGTGRGRTVVEEP